MGLMCRIFGHKPMFLEAVTTRNGREVTYGQCSSCKCNFKLVAGDWIEVDYRNDFKFEVPWGSEAICFWCKTTDCETRKQQYIGMYPCPERKFEPNYAQMEKHFGREDLNIEEWTMLERRRGVF